MRAETCCELSEDFPIMIIREESDESLFYDFTPVRNHADRGDFYFRDWMNSLSVGPLRLSGSGARADSSFREAACAGNPCRPLAKGKSVRREGPAYCCAMKASRRLTAAADASSLG